MTSKKTFINKDLERAYDWYRDHMDHIENMTKNVKKKVKPSTEDMVNPALWKPIHWNWFFNHLGLH